MLIWQARVAFPLYAWGLLLLAAGELLRLASLRASGKATRTRKVGARQLVTWGLYAHTRNPLYIGNFLLWLGAVLFAGGDWFYWLLLLVAAWFLWQYALIIALEETTLSELFGSQYDDFRRAVPRIIPRPWRSGRKRQPAALPPEGLHSWRYAFESERSTLAVVILVLAGAIISTYLKH